MDTDINYITGDAGIIDDIKELWEELNQIHIEKSLYFKQHYTDFTFKSRKETFLNSAENGELFIVIAYHKEKKIGYCVSSVVNKIGEIDSIYILPDYRKSHVGNTLMEKSINWIKENNAEKIIAKVSIGNEDVFGFYAKFGLMPRLTELQLIEKTANK